MLVVEALTVMPRSCSMVRVSRRDISSLASTFAVVLAVVIFVSDELCTMLLFVDESESILEGFLSLSPLLVFS